MELQSNVTTKAYYGDKGVYEMYIGDTKKFQKKGDYKIVTLSGYPASPIGYIVNTNGTKVALKPTEDPLVWTNYGDGDAVPGIEFNSANKSYISSIPYVFTYGLNNLLSNRPFSSLTNCTLINVVGVDSGEAVNMEDAFYDCTKLEWLRLPVFKAGTSMSNAFRNCSALKDLGNIMTESDFSSTNRWVLTFDACRNLDLTLPNNLLVGNICGMCRNLKSVNYSAIQTLRTQRCEDLESAFIRTIFRDEAGNAVTNPSFTFMANTCTNADHMFGYMTSLTELTLTLTTSQRITRCANMFRECSNLQKLHLTMDMSGCTDFTDMFYGCTKLNTIDGTISGIKAPLDLSACPLGRASVTLILNALDTVDTPQTLTLSNISYGYTTPSDVVAAAKKGWTVTMSA